MIRAILLTSLLAALPFGTASAETLKAAIFDLELVDTSLDGEMLGKSDIEQQRLIMLTERLRNAFDESEDFEAVDIAPVREEASKRKLQSCGGCDRRMAEELGADLAVTGTVHKVSNLILNINLYVRDVASGKLVAGGSADIRSNTDESWTRGLDWLLKNRLGLGEQAQ